MRSADAGGIGVNSIDFCGKVCYNGGMGWRWLA